MTAGEMLGRARKSAGVTVADLAQMTKIRASIIAAIERDDWDLWEPAVRKELEYAISTKSALTYRTLAQMCAARRDYPDVFEILHLVTPCVVKHDAVFTQRF